MLETQHGTIGNLIIKQLTGLYISVQLNSAILNLTAKEFEDCLDRISQFL